LCEGVDLFFLPIDDIISANTDDDIETPEGLVNVFHFDHLVHFTKFSVDEALAY